MSQCTSSTLDKNLRIHTQCFQSLPSNKPVQLLRRDITSSSFRLWNWNGEDSSCCWGDGALQNICVYTFLEFTIDLYMLFNMVQRSKRPSVGPLKGMHGSQSCKWRPVWCSCSNFWCLLLHPLLHMVLPKCWFNQCTKSGPTANHIGWPIRLFKRGTILRCSRTKNSTQMPPITLPIIVGLRRVCTWSILWIIMTTFRMWQYLYMRNLTLIKPTGFTCLDVSAPTRPGLILTTKVMGCPFGPQEPQSSGKYSPLCRTLHILRTPAGSFLTVLNTSFLSLQGRRRIGTRTMLARCDSNSLGTQRQRRGISSTASGDSTDYDEWHLLQPVSHQPGHGAQATPAGI